MLVACLLNIPAVASVSQGRIYIDNLTCCHTEIEAAEQTFHLIQSQYTDTRPTTPSTDPMMPGTWQGSPLECQFLSHWYDLSPEKSSRKLDSNLGSSAPEADALTTRPARPSCHKQTQMSPVTNKPRCHLSQTNQDVTCHKQTKMSPVTNKPRCHLSQTNQDVTCHLQTKMSPVTNKPRCHLSQTNQDVTGHKQTNMSPVTNLYSKLRIGHTEQCPCGTGSQTTEHLLQSHPIYEPLRKGIWPDHTPVARKLYGSLRGLQCTATFIEETGVSI